jgi:hypothetical protein
LRVDAVAVLATMLAPHWHRIVSESIKVATDNTCRRRGLAERANAGANPTV